VDFVVLDVETTGLSVERGARLIEIAGVRIRDWRLNHDSIFESLIDPGCIIPITITALTGISNLTVKGYPPVNEVLPDFFSFVENTILVIHNAPFDLSFLNHFGLKCGLGRLTNAYIDTVEMSRHIFRYGRNNLDILLARLGILVQSRHRALGDSIATAQAFLQMCERIGKENVKRFVREQADWLESL
jgi:DNA polymerase III epsilon subunit family exonuclease